jgi:phage-related protein
VAFLGGGGNTIRVRFLADTTQVGAAVGEMGSGISQGLGMAGLGWAAAGAAAVGFAKQSVDAAMAAEDAQAHLADAYERFPALHDASLKSLNDLADATLRKTRFDDEAARAAEAVLAQYHLTGKQILELLPLVTDYAAKTGKELPEAAETIGKAFLGNTRALKEVGINYKMTGDAATDYANIVKLLTTQVGGAAAKDAETTAGKLAMLTNQYGELKEQLGAALLPLIQAIVPVLIQLLTALTPILNLVAEAMQWLADKQLIFTVLWGATLGPMALVLDHLDWVKGALGDVADALKVAADWLAGAYSDALAWVTGALRDLWGAVTDVANTVGGFFTGAWDAAAGAINAVAEAVAWLVGKLRVLRDIWNSVSGFIGSIAGAIGLSAPGGATGYSAAPSLSPAAYGAPRASSGGMGSSAGLTVQINVHGNVGDPNIIGRRTVEALGNYVRANGARALRTQIGL